MADTSLNENRLGLLIWQTSNIWQSKLRKILKNHKISLNEYLIIETLFKLSSLTKIVSQISIATNSFLDVSVVSTNLTLLENKNLILRTSIDNRSKNILLTDQGLSLILSLIKNILQLLIRLLLKHLKIYFCNFHLILKYFLYDLKEKQSLQNVSL